VDPTQRSAPARYAVAILLVASAAALRHLVDPLSTTEAPLMLFMLPVTGAAWFGGAGPGILATALSVLVAVYRFMEPSYSFHLMHQSLWMAIGGFVIEGTAISLFLSHLHRVVRLARQSEALNADLERRILEISEAERSRIGQDLHDGVGQHLTGTSMMAKRLSQRLAGESSRYAADALKISELLNEAIGSTRDLGKLLSPPLLSQEGLGVALADLCKNAEALFGIRCTFFDRTPTPFRDPATGTHLYRITQEAISNAVKHGQAREVVVELLHDGPTVWLKVSNDGRPFVEPPPGASGLGLRIMRYRAKMIGARLQIATKDGKTAIICESQP
jgi:signal transduction histidine kinase